jgi:hypothetical protein
MLSLKSFNLLPVIILFALAISVQSCSSDDTAEPNIPGADRDKYTGNWICTETYSGQAPTTFTINVQKHGEDDTLYVYNFNNLGAQFYTIWLVSANSVTIPSQNVSGFSISGSGFYVNEKINLTYNSGGYQITAVCSK